VPAALVCVCVFASTRREPLIRSGSSGMLHAARRRGEEV